MKKNNKPVAKRYKQTVGMMMASMMVLSSAAPQIVYAKPQEEQKDEQSADSKEVKEERITIYLNGKTGDDKNSGESEKEPVKTFEKAAELVGNHGTIRISGMVTVEEEEHWVLPNDVALRRAKGYEDALVKVNGSLTMKNVYLYQEDIIGDGEVEGAVEKENVYVPKMITIKEAQPLEEISLVKCDGDGVFTWEKEEAIPEEYETVYQVIFRPYDTKKVDYSEEKGWDEEEKTVTRKITIRVTALKPEEEEKEETPENTPETGKEETPEAIVTPTPEPVPESGETKDEEKEPSVPEVTPEPEKEKTPEVSVTPTPEPVPETGETKEEKKEPSVPEVTPEAEKEVQKETEKTEQEPQKDPKKEEQEEESAQSPEATVTPTPEEEKKEDTETKDPQESEQGEFTWEQLQQIAAVQEQLDFLPSEITVQEEIEAILAATRQYEALSDAQKAYIESDRLVILQEAQESAKSILRTSNGVTVEGDFPWYVQFLVQLKNDKADAAVLENQGADTFISPYDMELWDLMKEEVYQLNGQQVRITMPAPDQKLYTQLVVVHYLEDGSVEYITPIYNEDGTLTFATTSFSPYNVAGMKLAGSQPLVGNTDKAYGSKPSGTTSDKLTGNVSANPQPSKKNNTTTQKPQIIKPQITTSQISANGNPKTGDMSQTSLYAGLAAAGLAVLSAVGNKKRKDKNS